MSKKALNLDPLEATGNQEAETPQYDKDTVVVRVWTPGFNTDTGEILNKPFVHITNRSDWEMQVAPLGDSKISTLEHLGMYAVEVLHLPKGCTAPSVNEKYVAQLKERGAI